MKDSKPTVDGETPFTVHHFYVGLAAMVTAFFLEFFVPWFLWVPLMVAGGLVAIDDAYKHQRQKTDPTYLSPYNRMVGWLFRRFQPPGPK